MGGALELARRGGVDGLPGRAAADGVPHCEGRRLASRGGGGGGRGGWEGDGVVELEEWRRGGGGYRDWRGTAPKVPAGIRRERERDRGEGLWRGGGRQADWKGTHRL